MAARHFKKTLWGYWYPGFGDVSSGFPKPKWAALSALRGSMRVPCNSTVAQHLPTSWQPALQPRGVLVLLKFYWAPDIVKFVLGRFSHFYIAIAYSNSKFCGAWTPSFCEFTQNFSKTSTPQLFSSTYLWAGIGGAQNRDLLCRRRMLYWLSCSQTPGSASVKGHRISFRLTSCQ